MSIYRSLSVYLYAYIYLHCLVRQSVNLHFSRVNRAARCGPADLSISAYRSISICLYVYIVTLPPARVHQFSSLPGRPRRPALTSGRARARGERAFRRATEALRWRLPQTRRRREPKNRHAIKSINIFSCIYIYSYICISLNVYRG